MKKSILLTLSLVLTLSYGQSQSLKFKRVFNGKNFKGWKMPDNNIWWSVNDGVMLAESGPEQKGTIIWTENEYEDFVLESDFKFGRGTVDSGFFLRSDKHQIQLGISASLKVDMTGSPYIVGKAYPVKAEVEDVLKPKDWNTMRIEAIANHYKVWLNGKLVLDYTAEEVFTKGSIGLQMHAGKDMSIEFRNVKVAKL